MHNEWLDLIPFYVAGTLTASEIVALEHHLARCEGCFRALEEWREVATVVRREAKVWGETLPPLSPSVRAQLIQPSQNGYNKTQSLSGLVEQTTLYAPKSRRPTLAERRLRPSLSLLAAILAVAIFSGILLYGATQSSGDRKSASSGDSGPTGLMPTYTPFILPTSLTASPTPTPSPTITPFFIDSSSKTPPTDDVSALAFPSSCVVTTTAGANIYQFPDANSIINDVIDPGETRQTIQGDSNGWYQVVDEQGFSVGWVSTNEVNLSGDCDGLPLATPTLIGTPSGEMCWVGVTLDSLVNIYRTPSSPYDVISTLQPGEFLRTIAKTQDGWFQVALEGGAFLGWVYVEDVELNGACDNLPVIAPSTIVPSATIPSDACLLNSLSGFGSNIYAGPGLTYNIINTFSDPLVVTGVSDNDWYRVERRVGDVRWIGWVSRENATISGNCDNLPGIPSTGYIPNPMPSVTPSPTR